MVDAAQSAVDENASTHPNVKIEVRDVSIRYGHATALDNVSLQVREHEIFGIIGPANAGKTSFLKALNRMDAFTPQMQVRGDVLFNGRNVRKMRNVYALRKRIGVVFPLPVGLPRGLPKAWIQHAGRRCS